MSDIATFYITQVNQVYDRGYELARITKDKADNFRTLSNFREYIFANAETINPFKSVSDDICQMIEARNFDVDGISLKVKEIMSVKGLIGLIKANLSTLFLIKDQNEVADNEKMIENSFINAINRLKNKHHHEVVGIENLIEDCYCSMTLGCSMSLNTVFNYKAKLENSKKRLQELENIFNNMMNFRHIIHHSSGLINQFKSITVDVCQVIDSDNFNKSEISSKLNQVMSVKGLISHVRKNIYNSKRFFTNETPKDVIDIESLIDDCFNKLTFSKVNYYTSVMENSNKILLKLIREHIAKFQNCISSPSNRIIGLKTDGTVVADGSNINGQCNTSDWKNIIAISADTHTVGLRADGTVVAIGKNNYGQCNTRSWRNMVAISANEHTVGLKADGTVVAIGNNESGQCNTKGWRDIVAISTYFKFTVGLKTDGTLVAIGDWGKYNTDGWRDIVAISTESSVLVGLKADGTVVAVGPDKLNTEGWSDIVAISAGSPTVGLKEDGTVVSSFSGTSNFNTNGWRDIVAISSSYFCIVGLKADGTVVAVGDNKSGECNTGNWRDIVAIFTGYHITVGLKADGTVVNTGRYNTNDWRDIGPFRQKQSSLRVDKDRSGEPMHLEQSNKWQSQGLCRYCGGKFGGLFSKKCNACGKPKDY